MITYQQVMNGSCGRLRLWRTKLEHGEFDMFLQLLEIVQSELPIDLTKEFVELMTNLVQKINIRFDEIQYTSKLNFVVNPFTVTTDDVAELGNLAQEEFIDIQVNTPAKRHIEKFGYVNFWITQGRELTPTLFTIAIIDAILPFPTTYLSENAFSAVTIIKTKSRNLRIALNYDAFSER